MLGKTEGKRRIGQQRMRWSDAVIDSMDTSLSKRREIVKDREAWYAAVHGAAKKWTRLSDRTTSKMQMPHRGNPSQCIVGSTEITRSTSRA